MAKIHPFKAVRPSAGKEANVASVPYDVVNRAEAKELAGSNKESFLHIVRPEIDFDDSVSQYDDSVYAKARENLDAFIKDGVLFQEEKACYYLYRQKMGDHVQNGLVTCVPAQDYFDGKIKKHELTRKDKEEDRTRHVLELNANTGPVFLTYKDEGQFDTFYNEVASQKPIYDFTAADGIEHTVYLISDDEMINKISDAFVNVPCTYIADGHHRSAAGALAAKSREKANPNHTGDEEYNRYLAILFPDNQLKILDYNRAVHNLNGLSSPEFMSHLSQSCYINELSERRHPKALHEVMMYLDDKWYSLEFKENFYANASVVEALDVALLQKNVLAPLLGIEDPRTSTGIDFIGGIRGLDELERLVNQGTHRVAFAMYPTSIQELMDIADAGEIMPPKSTWFEPKLRSGLLVHLLD